MLTDTPPRKTSSARFLQSDRMRTLDLPQDRTLLAIAKSIESGMKAGSSADVRRSCAEFLDFAAAFYEVPSCGFRVLAARPLRVRENWASELFGDYHPETMLIRIWMRTAVRREITSFGTFHNCLLICALRIAASACSAINELLAVEFQYSLRLIEPPLIRTRVWRHSNAAGPHHRRVQYQSAAWRALGKVSRYPSRNKAYLQGRSRWPRSRAIRGNP